MYIRGYESLSLAEQDQLRRALSRLLYEGSLQYALKGDRDAYELLRQYHETAQDCLRLFDTQLRVESDYGLIYFEPLDPSADVAPLRTRDEVALLAILRELLALHAKPPQLVCQVTLNDVRLRYETLMGSRLAPTRLERILRHFKKLKLIHYTSLPVAADDSLLILPLLFVITPADIDQMVAEIRADRQRDGHDDE